MIDNTLANHLLLTDSRLEHWLWRYSQYRGSGGNGWWFGVNSTALLHQSQIRTELLYDKTARWTQLEGRQVIHLASRWAGYQADRQISHQQEEQTREPTKCVTGKLQTDQNGRSSGRAKRGASHLVSHSRAESMSEVMSWCRHHMSSRCRTMEVGLLAWVFARVGVGLGSCI